MTRKIDATRYVRRIDIDEHMFYTIDRISAMTHRLRKELRRRER
jgi:hypothetical protein